MEKYKVLLQLCVILSILFLIYLFYKFILSLIKKNRLSYYSINLEKEEYAEDSFIVSVICRFGKFLKSLVVFNGLGRIYDRYIDSDSRFKNGMDYVSLKILLGFLLVILYLLISFLYKNSIMTLIIVVTFILGFVLPDFYCFYLKTKFNKLNDKDILKAIIIMNNSYKVNRSNKQVIEDVISRCDGQIQNEFKKVLNDINLGMTLEEAIKRIYIRTGNKTFLDISIMISLNSKIGADKVDIINDIEKRLVDEEKFYNELYVAKSINKIAVIVFGILPLLFITYLISFNKDYINLLVQGRGVLIILILAIIYLLYILIICRIARGRYIW